MYIHSSSQETEVYETLLQFLAITLLSTGLQQLNGKIFRAAVFKHFSRTAAGSRFFFLALAEFSSIQE